MATHTSFSYKNRQELVEDIGKLGAHIRLSDDISTLAKPLAIGRLSCPNRLAIHPMEGCDGESDGSPAELTKRRYNRFSQGGAGLLWYEATAVTPEGRANPRQLHITEKNVPSFANMLDEARRVRTQELGSSWDAVEVVQLTHSGRYSKPDGKPKPIIAHHDEYLDVPLSLDKDYKLITDDELERLEDAFVDGAGLATQAGFPVVDVKACHRYLPSELLAAHTREGKYGGSYENRTRFLKNVVAKIKAAFGDNLEIAVRLNAYDGIPYPYGWGMSKDNAFAVDLAEPVRLVKELAELGVSLINITVGNPYYNPHFGRPYDNGTYRPNEHQLEGISRMFYVGEVIQKAVPNVPVMGTGYTWLRQYSPYAASANIDDGRCSLAGFGRMAFAYPDFAKDIIINGELNPALCCSACSLCTAIMRDGGMAGCVPRDSGVYSAIFKAGRVGKPALRTMGDPTWHI